VAAFKALLLNGLINCVSEVLLLPRHLKLFWIGLLIYVASFFLFATGGSVGDGRMPGFLCAFFAFVLPPDLAKKALFDNVPISTVIGPVPYFSLLIAGWINPVFLITAFLFLAGIHRRLADILKVAVVLMIPFTWLFFATDRMFHPREGHFFWVVGMLLVLFSDRLVSSEGLSLVGKSW